jgi:hypothetical protein
MAYDWTGHRTRRAKLLRNVTFVAILLVLIALPRLLLR